MEPAPAIGIAPQVVEIPMPEEIHERYLVVREVTTQDVVTVLGILSLANKLTHEGREAYEAKRTIVLGSKTNLVEIYLLRAGPTAALSGRAKRLSYFDQSSPHSPARYGVYVECTRSPSDYPYCSATRRPGAYFASQSTAA